MPPATARRCLLTLEELGYVMRRGRTFLLRPKVLELGAAYLESMDIEHLTKTHLEELARLAGDSAALSVLDGTDIVYVARVAVSSPAKGSSLARLRSVLEDRGFEVNDRDGELVAHDATDVTAVVYPRTPVSATPGLSMVRFSGSSPCVRYGDADVDVADGAGSTDYSH